MEEVKHVFADLINGNTKRPTYDPNRELKTRDERREKRETPCRSSSNVL